MMIALTIISMVISCVIGAIASLLLKRGSDKFIIKFTLKGITDILKNWKLILGVILYIISAVIFIIVLKSQRLSFIYPLSSLTYIFITILSAWILKEHINRYKIIGISLVILGVVLISL